MTFLRIEHESTGVGPYQSQIGIADQYWDYQKKSTKRPMPDKDLCMPCEYGYKFGHPNLGALLSWWDSVDILRFVYSKGCKIYLCVTREDVVYKSDKQLAVKQYYRIKEYSLQDILS